jgi:medium-chain acyl-[acyl-carrier-protein] hydrolase
LASHEILTTNDWISGSTPSAGPNKAIRLFCLPHAGGGASVFRPWMAELAPDIDVYPVQLPGREGRWREPALTQISELVPALSEALRPLLQSPYALFGHSMGAFVAFELARQLRRENRPGPAALIVSAARAPQIPDPDPPLHARAAEELLDDLKRLRGIPEELLDHPDLVALLLPTLRADLTMCETYAYANEAPLMCPISVLGAENDDKVPLEHLAPWRTQAAGQFQLRVFQGDHFFYLKESRNAVTEAIRETLRQHTAEPAAAKGLLQSGHTAKVIAGVWREVLRVPHAGLDDNFFGIGGNSLLMVQAYVKLREATNTPLSVLDLFRYPTIRLLASAMEAQEPIPQGSRSRTPGDWRPTTATSDTPAEFIQEENP